MGRIEAINGETQLPIEIIHQIQSFLSGKEAARTTILSKSWYEAWLTRPNLVFSEADIQTTPFMDFGKKTIQRYEKSNLKIQSFKLLIDGCSSKGYLSDRISLAEDWTRKAMKLGATDIDIKISYKSWEKNDFIFVLPQEVFESETLVKLSLVGSCKIDLKGKKVNCSGLKSLILGKLGIEGNTNIWDIISMCPLIEELVLSKCSYRNSGSYEKLVLKSGLGMNSFRMLKVLLFKDVELGEGFSDDFSSKFPCIKDLGLHNCKGCEEIQICSDSLEHVSFVIGEFNVVEFDVPRIKKFTFLSLSVPSLSFKTTSTEWESRISIDCRPEITFFTKLRKFLQELSPSKIYLNVWIAPKLNKYDYARYFICLPKPPTVEKLTIQMPSPSLVNSVVLEDLFWICRPNFLVLDFWPNSISKSLNTNNSDLMKLICNIPIEKGNENRNMTELEEVKFGFFRQGSGGELLPLSCKTLIEASAFSGDTSIIVVSLQLKWVESI